MDCLNKNIQELHIVNEHFHEQVSCIQNSNSSNHCYVMHHKHNFREWNWFSYNKSSQCFHCTLYSARSVTVKKPWHIKTSCRRAKDKKKVFEILLTLVAGDSVFYIVVVCLLSQMQYAICPPQSVFKIQ